MRAKIRVARAEEVAWGEPRLLDLGRGEDGFPRQAVVLRDSEGVIRAYRNECKHLPIPLGAGSGRVLTKDGRYLLCSTHGATYQLSDGLCVAGPCDGALLDVIELAVVDGVVFLVLGPDTPE